MHLEEGSRPIFTFNALAGETGSSRQAIDAGVAAITHILRWLLGESWSPASICFMHARCGDRLSPTA